ncbi:hypothetical protein LXA43DRAFT_1125932 [Ganoderma leucocontextum]|nr:hypothetical protein LXA43DRAFT_1125932 [Ganoderma leucocontextum]
MSPIRTRAQIRRKSGVFPPPSPPAPTGKTLVQPHGPIAPAMRSSIIKKLARRRTSFKIEVLADRTSSLNVAQQKKLRRMTSFHPETVSLIEATPVDELKKAPSVQVNEKRRRRVVPPISPSPNTSVVHRGQGQQTGGQPRSILRVFRDDEPPRPPPSDIAPAGTLRGNSNVLGTPLYALSEVPRGITMLSVDDTPSGLSSAVSGESSGAGAEKAPCATLRVPVKPTPTERNGSAAIPPSRPQATGTTGTMTSATQAPRAAVDGPPAILRSSAPVGPTRTKARCPTNNPINDRAPAPAPLPNEMPVVRQQGWLKLPENRVDRWIMVFCMVYAPIILPLLLRVLVLTCGDIDHRLW